VTRRDPELDVDLQRFVDRAAAQIAVPPRPSLRTRRLGVLPLVGAAAVVVLVFVAALSVGRAINESRRAAATQPAASASIAAPRPSREPADLAELPDERAVLTALDAGGLRVHLIGGSKDEGILGTLLPARSFIITAGSAGADVLFLRGRGVGPINVCAAPGSTGRTVYFVYVAGQRTVGIDAGQAVYFLISSDYFVTAYDRTTRDALAGGLGLVAPDCTPTGFEIRPVAPAQTSGTGRASFDSNGDLVLAVSVRGPAAEIGRPPGDPQRSNLIWHLLTGTCAAWRTSTNPADPALKVLARWTLTPQQPDAQDFRYVIPRADLEVYRPYSPSASYAVAAYRNGGGGPLYACGDLPPL
jgi:hypothetical protein